MSESFDWNGTIIRSTKARTVTISIDKAYSTSPVTSEGDAGGLIGALPLDFMNINSSNKYLDIDYKVTLLNAYSTGEIKGKTVGGLIGNINGSSQNVSSESGDTAYTFKQGNKLTIANAFSAATVEGTTAGGFIGNYNYANSLDSSYAHLINNIYSTSIMQEGKGALFGSTVANATVKNLYFWPKSGAADVTPNGTIKGALEFEYVNAIPVITQDKVNLLNQLNGNIKGSVSDELKTGVSANWIEKEHALSAKLKGKLPFLEIGPSTMPWEKEQEDNNSEQNDR